MNINSNYFLYQIFIENVEIINSAKLDVKFNNIKLKSPYDNNIITISDRDIFIETNDKKNCILLYIEDNEQIESLYNEDYTTSSFNIDFYYDGKKIEVTVVPKEQISGKDIYEDFLYGLLQNQFSNETCCLYGLPPDKLYGYNIEIKAYKQLAHLISKKCISQIENNNVEMFISNATLGTSVVSFFAVEYLKKHGYPNLKNILAIPFKNMYTKWGEVDKCRYKRMIQLADYVIEVDKLNDYSVSLVAIGEYHSIKFKKSLDFLVDSANNCIVIHDRVNTLVNNFLHYAGYKKCKTDVYYINKNKKGN